MSKAAFAKLKALSSFRVAFVRVSCGGGGNSDEGNCPRVADLRNEAVSRRQSATERYLDVEMWRRKRPAGFAEDKRYDKIFGVTPFQHDQVVSGENDKILKV